MLPIERCGRHARSQLRSGLQGDVAPRVSASLRESGYDVDYREFSAFEEAIHKLNVKDRSDPLAELVAQKIIALGKWASETRLRSSDSSARGSSGGPLR